MGDDDMVGARNRPPFEEEVDRRDQRRRTAIVWEHTGSVCFGCLIRRGYFRFVKERQYLRTTGCADNFRYVGIRRAIADER